MVKTHTIIEILNIIEQFFNFLSGFSMCLNVTCVFQYGVGLWSNQGWPGYIPGYIPNLPTGLGFLRQRTRVFLIESGFFITLTYIVMKMQFYIYFEAPLSIMRIIKIKDIYYRSPNSYISPIRCE